MSTRRGDRRSRLRAALVVLCVLVGIASTHSARANDLELVARVGYVNAGSRSPVALRSGGFGGTSAAISFFPRVPLGFFNGDPYRGGVDADLRAGMRVLGGALSFGITAGARRVFASSSAASPDDLSRWAWKLGGYLRAYAPKIGDFEPWWSTGLEYVVDHQSFTAGQAPTIEITHRGLAVPFALGIDWVVSPRLAIGPSFEIARVMPLSACWEGPTVNRSTDPNPPLPDACGSETVTADAYTVWSIALGARMTL